MKCVICGHGQTAPGTTDVLLTRGGMTLVIKGVPALVCRNCGEEYVDKAAGEALERAADEAEQAGVQVDVRRYAAA